MSKLSQIFDYPKLSRYEGLYGRIPLQNKHVYFGIEVEAEKVSGLSIKVPGSWKVVEDGSLKVAGLEFVTVPIKLMYLEVELLRLFSAIPNASFSPRTSIHAHMNVRDLTMAELEKFIILYMIFEKILYSISGDRFSNNFCVPLYEAPFQVKKFLTHIPDGHINQHWSKYHGMNLTPIWGEEDASARIGTAEFRHMAGTNDISKIIKWCDVLACLKAKSKTITKEDLVNKLITHELNSKTFIYSIFGNYLSSTIMVDGWESMIQTCISKTKCVLASTGKYNTMFGPISGEF